MASRNSFVSSLQQSLRKDSVSWGSLALWIGGLIVIVSILSVFSNPSL
jgi:hypothetical protein